MRHLISKNQSQEDKRGKKYNPLGHTSIKTKKRTTTTSSEMNEPSVEVATETKADAIENVAGAIITTSPMTGPSRSTFSTKSTSVRNKAKISS